MPSELTMTLKVVDLQCALYDTFKSIKTKMYRNLTLTITWKLNTQRIEPNMVLASVNLNYNKKKKQNGFEI